MGTREASEIRVGNVIKIDGNICKVIAQEIRGTGKSGKTVQLKLKGLLDGRFIEKSFRTEEKAEAVDVQHATLQYLYKDGESFVFMNNETYEQFPLSAKAIGKQEIFLKENAEVKALCIDDKPVSIEFPKIVELKVVSAPPAVQSDGNFKEVELENGLKILAPQFVKEGDSLRIDSEDFTYLERVTLKSMRSGAEIDYRTPGEKKEK
jgi:elongation factor P